MKSLVEFITEQEEGKEVWTVYDKDGTIVNFSEDEAGAKKIASDYESQNPDNKCEIKKELMK